MDLLQFIVVKIGIFIFMMPDLWHMFDKPGPGFVDPVDNIGNKL